MSNPRPLLTQDGRQLFRAIADLMSNYVSSEGVPGNGGVVGPNRQIIPTPVVDEDALPVAQAWSRVLVAYEQGLFGPALPFSDDEQARLAPQFRSRLTDIYWQRFSDFKDQIKVGLVEAQATILGELTAAVFLARKGSVPAGGYPKPDPNAVLSVSDLDFARDVLGFWMMKLNKIRVTIPRDGIPLAVATEFDNGCSIC